jgi:Protein of unknown function (DUF2587)
VTDPVQPQIVTPGAPPQAQGPDEGQQVIAHPAKLLRIASMIRELVEEVRQISLDEKGRERLAEVYKASLGELREALSEELQQELDQLLGPLEGNESESEIRVAQAQLLGWLEGLFHGIQAALWAQHAQAQAALAEMSRRQLPSGVRIPGRGRGPQEAPDPAEPQGPPGQYL